MENLKNIAPGFSGINSDSHPSTLRTEEITYALNSLSESSDGNAFLKTNEPSNLLCNRFTEGYKVVGRGFNINDGRIYFMLTNPETGASEIGYIESIQNIQNIEDTDATSSCNCDYKKILATPLEDQEQVEHCTFISLLKDDCNLCLNFSIYHPMRSIVFKENNMYFTDDYNPQRYLKLDKIEDYKYFRGPVCDDEPILNCDQDEDCDCEDCEDTCPNCEKLKIFGEFPFPCYHPEVLINGGNLKMGTYQFLVAISDAEGNELSEYFSATPPVCIFDQYNNTLDQTELARETNYGIRIKIENLDPSFEYYKVAVIQSTSENGAYRYYVDGVYPTSTTTFTYTTENNKTPITIEEIYAIKTKWERAKGLVASGGTLFQHGLTAQEEINLQPVVILMSAFAKWQMGVARESLYKDGASDANYGGWMRNEQYAIGIKFGTSDGYVSSPFVWTHRPPTDEELEIVATDGVGINNDIKSVLEFTPVCNFTRDKRWQFYNTATISDEQPCQAFEQFECDTDDSQRIMTFTGTSGTANITIGINIYPVIFNTSLTQTAVDFVTTHSADLLSTHGFTVTANGATVTFTHTTAGFPSISNAINATGDLAGTLGSLTAVRQNLCECFDPETDPGTLITQDGVARCEVEVLNDTTDRTWTFVIPDTYTNLRDFINDLVINHPDGEDVFAPGGEYENSYIYGILTDPYVGETCTPTLSDNCNLGTLSESNVLITEVVEETVEDNLRDIADYEPTDVPSICNAFLPGTDAGGRDEDGDFLSAITGSSNVYLKNSIGLQGTCAGAFPITNNNAQGHFMEQDFAATEAALQTALITACVGGGFTNRVHTKARWFKFDFNGAATALLEVSRATFCDVIEGYPDAPVTEVRLSFFDDCSQTTSTDCEVVDLASGEIIELTKADFGGNEVIYIAVDAPIENPAPGEYYVHPPCGCFSLTTREYEIENSTVSWSETIVSKEFIYETECCFIVPEVDECEVAPYLEGKFGYWESLRTYPDNKELYDASVLKVRESAIPASIKDDFEDYFTDGGTVDGDGFYELNQDSTTQLYCKPIRHYKMPNNDIAPFMFNNPLPGFQDPPIFPLGIKLDNDVINFFLDVAVDSGLITQELRNKITRYEILRGDRSLDKSIITKGLLFDMYRYQDNSNQTIHYPNYPYNSLGNDAYHYAGSSSGPYIAHPFDSLSNNRYTFHGPETHFMQPPPFLPNELEYEGDQYGRSRGNFVEVEGHPKYVVLGRSAYTLATVLGAIEAALEAAITLGRAYIDYAKTYYVEVGASNGANPVGIGIGSTWITILTVAQVAATTMLSVGRYRYEWLTLFRNNGSPRNFAYQYSSHGYYNYLQYDHTIGNRLRGLAAAEYLKGGGRHAIMEKDGSDVARINNDDRESSVFLSFGNAVDYPDYAFVYSSAYRNYDNYSTDIYSASRRVASDSGNCDSREFDSNIASPYVSLKNFNAEQYGDVNNIKWLSTNYCGKLLEDNDCEIIWGGDVRISRLSLKRKLPHFLVNAIGQADHTPFAYTLYNNIGNVKHYGNFNIELGSSLGVTIENIFLPDIGSEFVFNCFEQKFYITPPSKFFLFNYGIPRFLVESEINLNYRYARKEPREWFFPNGGATDYNWWTQEKNVPIRYDNEYNYNFAYSRNLAYEKRKVFPVNYNAADWAKKAIFTNGVIGSQPDITQLNTSDPWINYKPFDTYEFPSTAGTLVDLKDIESGQILARFSNQFILVNSIDVLRERLNAANRQLGVGIFGQRAVEFKRTELGYAGTQHKEAVSTEYGTFWVDAKRGQVVNVGSDGANPRIISEVKRDGSPSGVRNWFKEHLPFKILRGGISGITENDVDNAFNGAGIAMGWDARFRRLFITKKDYQVNVLYKGLITFDEGQYYVTPTSSRTLAFTGTSGTATVTVNGVDYLIGFTTNLTLTAAAFVLNHEANILAHSQLVITANAGVVTFTGPTDTFSAISIVNVTGDLNGTLGDITGIREEIELTDTEYFTDASWTRSYAPVEDAWPSFFSFKPNYYIAHQHYFQTGWNNGTDEQNGLWSHLLTNRSYTVFCGTYYPFILEVPSIEKYATRISQSVEYWLDVRHYSSDWDYAEQRDLGFSKAWIYNNSSHSGELELITELKNNRQGNSQYPKTNATSTSILQSETDKHFTFNGYLSRVRNELNGQPLWLHDVNGLKTSLNPNAFNYVQRGLVDRMRGDWFQIRLEYFRDSRYKVIFKWLFSKENVQP